MFLDCLYIESTSWLSIAMGFSPHFVCIHMPRWPSGLHDSYLADYEHSLPPDSCHSISMFLQSRLDAHPVDMAAHSCLCNGFPIIKWHNGLMNSVFPITTTEKETINTRTDKCKIKKPKIRFCRRQYDDASLRWLLPNKSHLGQPTPDFGPDWAINWVFLANMDNSGRR